MSLEDFQSLNKKRFYLTIEVHRKYEKTLEQYEFFLPLGVEPNVGNIAEFLLKVYKVHFDFRGNLQEFTYRPIEWDQTEIHQLIIKRVSEDPTFVKIIKPL